MARSPSLVLKDPGHVNEGKKCIITLIQNVLLVRGRDLNYEANRINVPVKCFGINLCRDRNMSSICKMYNVE